MRGAQLYSTVTFARYMKEAYLKGLVRKSRPLNLSKPSRPIGDVRKCCATWPHRHGAVVPMIPGQTSRCHMRAWCTQEIRGSLDSRSFIEIYASQCQAFDVILAMQAIL